MRIRSLPIRFMPIRCSPAPSPPPGSAQRPPARRGGRGGAGRAGEDRISINRIDKNLWNMDQHVRTHTWRVSRMFFCIFLSFFLFLRPGTVKIVIYDPFSCRFNRPKLIFIEKIVLREKKIDFNPCYNVKLGHMSAAGA